MRSYIVDAARSDGWWALSVRGLPGVHSQVRSLAKADDAIREAIALATDSDPFELAIGIEPAMPKKVRALLSKSRRQTLEAQRIQREAAALSRRTARDLIAHGYSQRDAATVLGVSFQRISQLVNDPVGVTDDVEVEHTQRTGVQVGAAIARGAALDPLGRRTRRRSPARAAR